MVRTNPNHCVDPFHPSLAEVLNEEYGLLPRRVQENEEPTTSLFKDRDEDGVVMFVSLDANPRTGFTGKFSILNNYPGMSTDCKGRSKLGYIENLVAAHNLKHHQVLNPEVLHEDHEDSEAPVFMLGENDEYTPVQYDDDGYDDEEQNEEENNSTTIESATDEIRPALVRFTSVIRIVRKSKRKAS